MKVIIFDTETTGLSPTENRVFQLSILRGTDKKAQSHTWMFNPGQPMPEEATAVHGYTDEDLKDKPPFKSQAKTIKQLFEEADVLVGYNVDFDIKFIEAELERNGQPTNMRNKIVVDVMKLWKSQEGRTLQDAFKRFVGGEFPAHDALEDVLATRDVLKGIVKEYDLKEKGWSGLQDMCMPDREKWIGGTPLMQWSKGNAVIMFGKHKGKKLSQVLSLDASYLEWLAHKSDMPEEVKRVAEAAYASTPEKVDDDLKNKFK